MATELAAGYVSLSVRLAKGATKEITKEVSKAGTEGGKSYSDEFNKQVEKDVGKKLPDAVVKSTKKGGGLGKAAKEAAEEFGKGFREGVEKAIKDADAIGGATKSIQTEIEGVTKKVSDLGKELGIDTGPLESFSKTAVTKIDAVGIAAGKTVTALDGFKKGDVVTGLQATTDALDSLTGVGLPKSWVGDAQIITDAVSDISGAIDDVKTGVDAFKKGDIAGGLESTVNALKGLEDIGLPEGFANEVGTLADNYERIGKQVDPVTDGLKEIGGMAPGTGLEKLADNLGLVGDAIKIVVTLQPELAKLDDYLAEATSQPLNLTPLENLRNVLHDINEEQRGSPRFAGTPGARP